MSASLKFCQISFFPCQQHLFLMICTLVSNHALYNASPQLLYLGIFITPNNRYTEVRSSTKLVSSREDQVFISCLYSLMAPVSLWLMKSGSLTYLQQLLTLCTILLLPNRWLCTDKVLLSQLKSVWGLQWMLNQFPCIRSFPYTTLLPLPHKGKAAEWTHSCLIQSPRPFPFCDDRDYLCCQIHTHTHVHHTPTPVHF